MTMKSVARLTLGTLLMTAVATQAFGAEYLVKYKNAISVMSLMSKNSIAHITDYNPAGQLYKVEIPDDQKIEGLLPLISNPNVEYVVSNFIIHADFVPMNVVATATATQTQWAIEKVEAQKAWDRAGNKGSRKVIVAVIDTGADYKHKNLAPNMITGFDFIKNDNDPMDITGENPGHGTHCSGIIGATGLIDGGTIGISPEVSIMPLRFLDQNGSGDLNNSVKAIDYAIAQKVDVISASWGASVPRKEAQPMIDAIARAEKAGIVFVVAASNDGKDNDSYDVYPANAGGSNVISVAASSSNDSRPSWSNYGKAKVNLASPGDAIMSTLPGDKYGELSGTSMATPLVAGLVALVKAQDPKLTPSQIRSLLQASADKVGIETACDCRVNAFSAVDVALSKKMFVSPYATTFYKGDKGQFEAVYGKAPFKFTSANPQIGTIDATTGAFTAVADGDTTVTVQDATGKTATSYKIYVADLPPPPPPDDPNQPTNPNQPGGSCPLGDPAICQALCQMFPNLPMICK
jgi:thermitase